LVDKELLLSDAQDLSQTAGSYYSTNVVDLGVIRDVGKGKQLYAVICVDEAFVGAGATVVFSVIDDNDGTLDASSVVLLSTPALGVAVLTLGRAPIVIPIPGNAMTQRYLGMKYVIAGATTTAGTVTAFLAFDYQSN